MHIVQKILPLNLSDTGVREVSKPQAGHIVPTYFSCLQITAETSELPKKITNKTHTNSKTDGHELLSKKYLGSSQPLFKLSHLGTFKYRQLKQAKMKSSHSSFNFGHTDHKFCTPPMIHKNEQLLFSKQKISTPNQISFCHFVFS